MATKEEIRTDYPVPRGRYIRISIDLKKEERKAFYREMNQAVRGN